MSETLSTYPITHDIVGLDGIQHTVWASGAAPDPDRPFTILDQLQNYDGSVRWVRHWEYVSGTTREGP